MKKFISISYFVCFNVFLILALPVTGSSADIRTFVHQTYIEGVPYSEVAKMNPDEAVPVLLEMLNDTREEEYLPNIVVTLGMLGDERAVEPLIRFTNRAENNQKLSPSQSRAKFSAVMALGYIVNKTSNVQAFEFLKEGIDPKAWDERNLRWTTEFFPSNDDRNNQMAIMSTLGLGISGNAEAKEILLKIKQPVSGTRFESLRRTIPDIDNVVDQAIKTNQEVSREGLRQYYNRIQPQYSNVLEQPRGIETPRALGEVEVLRSPVAGEVLKAPRAGEVLKAPRAGEVLRAPQAGEVLKAPQAGEVLSSPQ